MRTATVTGSTGFTGSFFCGRLSLGGFRANSVDAMTDYYNVWMKQKRLGRLLKSEHFLDSKEHAETLVLPLDLFEPGNPDVAIHLAAQAGVR